MTPALQAVLFARAGGLLPFGAAGIYAGDSITANGTLYTGTGAGSLDHGSKGYSVWAQAMAPGLLGLGLSGNQGVSGDLSNMLLARFPATIAQAPKVCVLEVGPNDVIAVTSAAEAAATITSCTGNIANMIAQLRQIHCRIILFKILPRGSSGTPMTANQVTAWNGINAWIVTQVANDIQVIDTEPLIGNNDANHSMAAGFSNAADFTHPNATAAKLIGNLVSSAIRSWVSTGSIYPASNNDPTDLLPNSQMSGTTGGLSGATGSVATSWTLQGSTAGGATVVGSKLARTDGGGAWQVVTISGTYTGNTRSVSLQQTVDLTGTLVAGSVVQLAWEVEIDAGSVGIANLVPELNIWGGAPLITLNSGAGVANNLMPSGAISATFVSQPFTMNATAVAAPDKFTAFLFIYLLDTATTDACSAVVRIGRPRLVKLS